MRYKKVCALWAVCAVFTVFSLFYLTACKSALEKYDAQISELRTNVYSGGAGNVKVTAITGKRENPYILDGHAAGARVFTLITLQPAEYVAAKTYAYTANIDGKEYSGELLPHPFGKTFSADINARCASDTVVCRITEGGETVEYSLKSVKTPDMIDEVKALEIARVRLKKQIKTFEAGGRL
ncbi:MAG: hypothetical protein LBT20_01965, partial [Clostridiales bacterium]|nr:hypothetical protein [Clostridiales bacterium]